MKFLFWKLSNEHKKKQDSKPSCAYHLVMNFNKKATLSWFIYTFFLIFSFNVSFILVLCSLNMIYLGLFCIIFSQIPGLVACFLSLFLENSYSLLQIFCTYYVYVRVSLVAQTVKNLSAMQENQVWSLGQEIPCRRERQPTPVLLPGESHGQRSLAGCSLWSPKEWDTIGRISRHTQDTDNYSRSTSGSWNCLRKPGHPTHEPFWKDGEGD